MRHLFLDARHQVGKLPRDIEINKADPNEQVGSIDRSRIAVLLYVITPRESYLVSDLSGKSIS
jgi:hypothetical protein